MDLATNEKRAALVHAVSDFAESALALAPHANEHFPLETLREVGRLGLGGVNVPERGRVRTEPGRRRGHLRGAGPRRHRGGGLHLHLHMVAWIVDRFGDEDQRQRWLPPLVTMGDLASYCLTEPGSDAAALATSARRDGDGYVINGTKRFTSGAGASSVYLVMARTGERGGAASAPSSCRRVTPASASVRTRRGRLERPTDLSGRARRRPGTRFAPARRGGDGFGIAMGGLNAGRLNLAAAYLGGAQWALGKAARYVQERKAFLAMLARNEMIAFKLADMETEPHAARSLV